MHYDENGSLELCYTYEYDSNGKKIKEVCDVVSDSISHQYAHNITYEYDSNGNEIKRTGYDENGSISFYCISEYSRSRKLIKESFYNADGTLRSYATYHSYPHNNLPQKETFHADGTPY